MTSKIFHINDGEKFQKNVSFYFSIQSNLSLCNTTYEYECEGVENNCLVNLFLIYKHKISIYCGLSHLAL